MKHLIHKILFLFAVLQLCLGSAFARTLYLDAGEWDKDNAKFCVYNISNNSWSGFMTKDNNTGYYSIDLDWTSIIFVRMNSAATSGSWAEGQKWGQTQDLKDFGNNNLYTITKGYSTDNKAEGAWSVYSGGQQGGQVYYIKHPWNGGGWTWQKLDIDNGDGTYATEGYYGEAGCNWNTVTDDNSAKWIGSPSLVGSPAKGDKCIFTLNPTKQTITIKKVTTTTTPTMYLIGECTDWSTGKAFTISADKKTATVSLSLSKDKSYMFKVRNSNTSDQHTKSGLIITRTQDGQALDFSTIDGGNGTHATIKADVTGDYTFTWTYETNTLSVTYPKLQTYDVTISAEEGGRVTPEGLQSIGSVGVAISATANAGYEFTGWECAGGAKVADSNATNTTVTATGEGTVLATFQRIPPVSFDVRGNFGADWKDYTMTPSEDGTEARYTIRLTIGEYWFLLKKTGVDEFWTATSSDYKITAQHPSVLVGKKVDGGNFSDISLTASEEGEYVITYNYAQSTVTVTYPAYNKTQYRLAYVETDKEGAQQYYHPSSPYIRAAEEGTAQSDTVSLHVRPWLPVIIKTSEDPATAIIDIDSIENTNTRFVYLEKWDGSAWSMMDRKDITNIIPYNGVYNFTIEQKADGSVIIGETIAEYNGNYYIRTDIADGGWMNYTDEANIMSYSDYASRHKHFDHYWCKWCKGSEGTKNITFMIANDYSDCISEKCTNELIERDFTEKEGTIKYDANIRFMWNSRFNILDRAYIAGEGSNLVVNPESKEAVKIVNQEKGYTFEDRQNWTYKIDLIATPNARIAIEKLPYNNANLKYYLVGDGAEADANHMFQFLKGEGRENYTMRIVYDFKSDHLIYAWMPDETTEITSDIDLGASIVLRRKNQESATQIVFNPDVRKIGELHEVIGVLTLTKDYFYDNTGNKPKHEIEYYWISFPFDVNVSDIFSTFVMGQHFLIQEYDGAARAKNGCFSDSPSYWRTLSQTETMKAGKGYMLYISRQVCTNDKKYEIGGGVKELNIYFPSSGVTEMTGVLPEIEVPAHTCTIERNNRDIYDSNWNLIGVPAWLNMKVKSDISPTTPEYTDVQYIVGDQKVGFYYHFNTGAEEGKSGNTWTPTPVSSNPISGTFRNMHSYLVQWAGTIQWADQTTFSSPATQSLQARREQAREEEQYTLRLALCKDEQELDQTFVRLQEDGDVTADFDLNYDMTKLLNPGANIYSLIGEKRIQAGANVQPLQEEHNTIYVPIGVEITTNGMYRFALPDGTEGMGVSLADHTTGEVHNLALDDYEVPLTKGTYEQRFVLEIQPKKDITTDCRETYDHAYELRKVVIDGALYIQRGNELYTVSGQRL